jgi:hypothetical protein
MAGPLIPRAPRECRSLGPTGAAAQAVARLPRTASRAGHLMSGQRLIAEETAVAFRDRLL